MKKKWVKVLSVSLCVAILVSTAIFASGTGGKISVQNLEVSEDSTEVAVAITLDENPGILGLQVRVVYDSGIKLVGIEGGNALSTLVMTPPGNFESGQTIAWDGVSNNDNSTGTLVTLRFDVSDAQPKKYEISISVSAFDENVSPVTFSSSNGSITVACEHTYGEWEKSSETQHKRVCGKCGNEEFADHTWDEGEVTTEPTCKDTGVKTYTCTVCGETKTETVPVTDEHTWGEWEKVDETNHKHTCSVCGKEETAAHTWDEGEVTTDPTHTEFGVRSYTCTACGATKTEQVDKLPDHTYGAWEKYDETQHKRTCACGDVQYADHTWDDGEITTEPTCKDTGIRTYTCTACGETKTETVPVTDEHTWDSWEKDDATNHKHTCSVCGREETAAHTWDEGEVTTEPTCKDTGVKTYTCTVCGETKTESVPVTDEHTWGSWEKVDETNHKHICSVCGKEEPAAHAWQEGEVTKEPTCKDTGIRVDTCVCGATKEVTLSVTDDHTWGSWEKDDETNHKHTCSVCGREETKAHTWDEGEVTTEPTCKDTGIKTYTCTACGETKTETVPVTDEHTWGEWEIVDETSHKHTCEICGKEETSEHTWDDGTLTIEPSGGKEGETTYTCTACGATRTEVVPANHEHSYSAEWKYDSTMHWHACSCGSKRDTQSHTWDAGTIQKEATCTEPGSVLYTCTVCGATKSESVSAEHTPSEWTVVTEASCTETGKQEQRCTVCGTVLKEMTIAATGHTAGAWEEEDGERVRKCTVCGEVLEREAIQTETPSATESTEPMEPTESTEPTDTTEPDSEGGGSAVAWIVVAVVVVLAGIIIAVCVYQKKKK